MEVDDMPEFPDHETMLRISEQFPPGDEWFSEEEDEECN